MQEDEDTTRTTNGDIEHHQHEGGFAAVNSANAYNSFQYGNGSRANPNSNIGTDMMAVARRIQERARVLNDEQRMVQATELVLLDLCKTLKTEQAVNDEQRRKLLLATNERNMVELEIFAVKDSIEEHLKQIKAREQETLRSQETIAELVAKRIETTKKVYGPNLARMETYSRVLETIVGSKEKAMQTRSKLLEDLRAQLEDSKTRNELMIRETKDTKESIDREEQQQKQTGSCGSDDQDHGADDDHDDGDHGLRFGRDHDGSTSKTNNSDSGIHSSAIGQEDKDITALSKRVREAIEEVSSDILGCLLL